MSLIVLLAVAWFVLALVMAALWARQKATGNAGTVDVAWSFGTGLAGVWFALAPLEGSDSFLGRQLVVAALAAFWATRLGLHVWHRVASGEVDCR